jgi:hypothetical protein
LTAGALTACGPAATTSTTTPAPPTGAAAPAVLFFSAGCGECVGGGTAVAGARAAVQKATGTARFLAVDMVPTENTADVHRFLDQIGDTNLPAVIDTHGDLTSRYQVTAQTTLLVIDPSGRITYRGHAPAQDQILTALGPSAAR